MSNVKKFMITYALHNADESVYENVKMALWDMPNAMYKPPFETIIFVDGENLTRTIIEATQLIRTVHSDSEIMVSEVVYPIVTTEDLDFLSKAFPKNK